MVLRYIGDAQWTALDADAKPTNAAVADTLTTLDTRRIFIHQGSAVWIEIGTGSGGGGGGGGGFAAGGTIARSGDGTSTIISIPHGLSPTPDLYYALPLNAAARGIISYGIDGTNINLTYPIAPASGSSNLSYVWGAGYVNAATGGFTPTSTTTLTGKTISELTNNLGIVQPYTWIVYKASSTLYKAKSGITGLTPYSGTNLKTDIIDNIKFSPVNGNHIHFLNASTPYDWPSGSTFDTGGNDYHVSGESTWGVLIRPLGNNQLLSCTNRQRQTFENFTLYVDSGATYTADAFRIVASAASCAVISIRNIRISHWDVSTRHQGGRAIVLLLAGADPSISWVNIDNLIVDGFNSAVEATTSGSSGFVWCNEINLNRIQSFHSKYFMRSNIPAVGSNMAYGWYWKNCAWQTTAVDATTESMFDIDITNAIHRGWDIDNCIMWDPVNTNKKFLKANTQCHVLIKGGFVNSDAYMGGSGWDAANLKWNAGAQVQRISPMMEKYGATSVADGGTITHGVVDHNNTGIIPKVIIATGRVAGQIVTVTARTATTFTVAIKTDAGTAGTTQIVDWYARGNV